METGVPPVWLVLGCSLRAIWAARQRSPTGIWQGGAAAPPLLFLFVHAPFTLTLCPLVCGSWVALGGNLGRRGGAALPVFGRAELQLRPCFFNPFTPPSL